MGPVGRFSENQEKYEQHRQNQEKPRKNIFFQKSRTTKNNQTNQLKKTRETKKFQEKRKEKITYLIPIPLAIYHLPYTTYHLPLTMYHFPHFNLPPDMQNVPSKPSAARVNFCWLR